LHLLLTGKPGVGKTTVIKRALEGLTDFKIAGFFTEEIREGRKRVGFKLKLVPGGEEGVLAHRDSSSPYRVGRYGVEVGAFEEKVIPHLKKALQEKVDIMILDEIGAMELMSQTFKKLVKGFLKKDVPRVLGTLQQRSRYLLMEWSVAERVNLIEVTEKNRDSLVAQVLKWAISK